MVLFFSKGEPTQTTWFYQLDPGRSLGKTNPLNDKDMAEFVKLQQGFDESEKSWSIITADIDQSTWDLSVKNPNVAEEAPLREPQVIIDEIMRLDKESEVILGKIQELL